MLSGYDMVLDMQGGETLMKSLDVLREGGIAVSLVGPPDIEFTRSWPMPFYLRLAIRIISRKIRHAAQKRKRRYRFLIMHPNGEQLRQIAGLIESGAIRAVIDRIYPFDQADEAMAHAETGRATGKIIVSRKNSN